MKILKNTLSVLLAIIFVVSCTIFTAAESQITISLKISETITNKTLFSNAEINVSSDTTALSILEESGLDYVAKQGYVSKIDDYKEFQYGKKSGWTYYVNGEQPMVSAAKYTLKNGDVVRWIYVGDYQQTTASTNQTDALNTLSTPLESEQNETTSAVLQSGVTESTSTTALASSSSVATSKKIQKTSKIEDETVVATVSQNDMVLNSLRFLKDNSGSFTPLVLSLFNQAIPSSLRKELADEAAQKSLGALQMSRLIINLSAVGNSLDNDDGVDLKSDLLNNKKILKTGLNGAIFALFAYEHCNVSDDEKFDNTNKSLADLIVNNQNEDGGFSLTFGEKSDVDITAMAISALSKQISTPSVKTAVDKALAWLSAHQNDDGSFSNSYGEMNCESTAQVIIAVKSVGLEPSDARFVKKDNAMNALLSFYSENGGFSHTLGAEADTIATEQALLAIYAENSGENPYTAKITNHIDEINFVPYVCVALGVLAICSIAILIMKKRGISVFGNEAKR